MLRRFLQEIDARRVIADVLTISDPAAAGMLIKRDLLVSFRPKNFDKIRDEVKDPKGYHIAQRLNLVGIVIRTDKVTAPPRNWTDLTDPKYKGQMVMADPSYTAIQLMVIGTLSHRDGRLAPSLRPLPLPLSTSSMTTARGQGCSARSGGHQRPDRWRNLCPDRSGLHDGLRHSAPD